MRALIRVPQALLRPQAQANFAPRLAPTTFLRGCSSSNLRTSGPGGPPSDAIEEAAPLTAFTPQGETSSSLRRKKGAPLLREVKYRQLQLKGSPKKLNLLAKLIRRMDVEDAIDQLRYSKKLRSAEFMKVLHGAVQKAEDHHGLKRSDLNVAVAELGKGRTQKKLAYHARGRAGIMKARSSHLTVVLREKAKYPVKKKKVNKQKRKWREAQERIVGWQ